MNERTIDATESANVDNIIDIICMVKNTHIGTQVLVFSLMFFNRDISFYIFRSCQRSCLLVTAYDTTFLDVGLNDGFGI